MRWYDKTEGPLRASGLLGERPAVSPSGAFIAWLPAREANVPLIDRERALVADVRTDQVLCALEAEATLRTLHWLRDGRLLVVRDGRKGMRVSVHAIPGGDAVAEGFLPGASELRHVVTQTPDGRVLCLHEYEQSYSARQPGAWLLDAQTLEVRRRSDLVRELCLLHPDGERIATLAFRRVPPGKGETLLATDPPSGPPFRMEPAVVHAEVPPVAWAGRDELRVLSALEPPLSARSPWIQGANGALRLASVDVRTGAEGEGAEVIPAGVRCWQFAPGGGRVALARRVERDEREPGLRVRVDVLDTQTGAVVGGFERRLSPRVSNEQGVQNHCVWSADVARLVFVGHDGVTQYVLVSSGEHDEPRALSLPLPPSGARWLPAYTVRGPYLCEHSYYETALRVIDLRAAT